MLRKENKAHHRYVTYTLWGDFLMGNGIAPVFNLQCGVPLFIVVCKSSGLKCNWHRNWRLWMVILRPGVADSIIIHSFRSAVPFCGALWYQTADIDT